MPETGYKMNRGNGIGISALKTVQSEQIIDEPLETMRNEFQTPRLAQQESGVFIPEQQVPLTADFKEMKTPATRNTGIMNTLEEEILAHKSSDKSSKKSAAKIVPI